MTFAWGRALTHMRPGVRAALRLPMEPGSISSYLEDAAPGCSRPLALPTSSDGALNPMDVFGLLTLRLGVSGGRCLSACLCISSTFMSADGCLHCRLSLSPSQTPSLRTAFSDVSNARPLEGRLPISCVCPCVSPGDSSCMSLAETSDLCKSFSAVICACDKDKAGFGMVRQS